MNTVQCNLDPTKRQKRGQRGTCIHRVTPDDADALDAECHHDGDVVSHVIDFVPVEGRISQSN